MFTQGGPVDIGIKPNRHAQRPADSLPKIGVGPAGFGRGSNVAKSGRLRVGINRSKRRNANGRQRFLYCLFFEICYRPVNSFCRRGGRKANFIP